MLEGLSGNDAEKAWRWFIDRYEPLIRAMLVRRLGVARAEAAADEFWGYLLTYRVIAKADRSRCFRPFLRGVVGNFACAWSRGDYARQDDDDAIPEPTALDPLAEDEELRLWARHLVGLAMTSMRVSHADAAELLQWFYGIHVDGHATDPLPVSEIARRRACKPNAIHQALYRARAHLRQLVEVEMRETVADRTTLEEELAVLFAAIGKERPGLVQ